MLVKRNKD